MTEHEICREYRAAKYKNKQVEILAELNGLELEQIVDILLRGGEQVRYLPSPRGNRVERGMTDGEYCALLSKKLEELEGKLAKLEKEYRLVAKIMKHYPVEKKKGRGKR